MSKTMQNPSCAVVDMMFKSQLTNSHFLIQQQSLTGFTSRTVTKREKKGLTISPIIATSNPREQRRNEAINSKKDLSGCARSEHWFSLDWTPYCCPFVIYVRLTSHFQQWHLFPIYSFQGTYCGFHFVSWFSFFWLLWNKAAGVVLFK